MTLCSIVISDTSILTLSVAYLMTPQMFPCHTPLSVEWRGKSPISLTIPFLFYTKIKPLVMFDVVVAPEE